MEQTLSQDNEKKKQGQRDDRAKNVRRNIKGESAGGTGGKRKINKIEKAKQRLTAPISRTEIEESAKESVFVCRPWRGAQSL